MFKELKLSGEKHIILDFEIEYITHILQQAEEVHFMGDYQNYVITNLVSHKNKIYTYIVKLIFSHVIPGHTHFKF